MKNLKTLLLGALVVGSFIACSDDDDNGTSGGGSADARTELYASNNSNGDITVFDLDANTRKTFVTTSLQSEGIYYDASADVVTQASRSSLQLNSYANVSTSTNDVVLTASVSTQAVLESPRDIAVSGNIYVVADNADVDGNSATADGRLFVFVRANDGSFTLRNTVTTNFKVWGIEFVNNDLYAVVDTTNRVALFADFVSANTTDATVNATKTVAFEGIVRTHGIAFDGGTMILTDVGAGASTTPGFDTDGAFHVVTNFTSKFNAAPDNGTVVLADQTRVSGSATLLGNPVAAEFDSATNVVYIAEAANGGGRVLTFASADVTAGGNATPAVNAALSSASSLYLSKN